MVDPENVNNGSGGSSSEATVQPKFSSNLLASIEKLKGRENYANWSFAMENYFEHCGLMNCIRGDEQCAQKLSAAKTSLVFSVDPVNYVHIRGATTVKEAWDKLKLIFEDNGLTRKIGLIRMLVTTQLENCSSVEEYVNKIIGTAHKLANIGCALNEEWIGAFLLAGLPERYNTMVMGIESSGITITGDSIKQKLLQDIGEISSGESAFFSGKKWNKKTHGKKSTGFRCYNCNESGHKANVCPKDDKRDKSGQNQNKKSGAFSVVFVSGNFGKDEWYLDSGASQHMTVNAHWLSHKSSSDVGEIMVANSKEIKVECKGSLTMHTRAKGTDFDIEVNDVLYVPDLATNLLSVGVITNNGNSIEFDENECWIYNEKHELMVTATKVNNVYKINNIRKTLGLLSAKISDINIWHRRLGHMNHRDMIKMKNGIVSGIDFNHSRALNPCVPCLQGKQTRSSFKRIGTRTSNILDLVHTDLCGPMEIQSIGGARYLFTLTDDFSRKTFEYFLNSKTEVSEKFLDFKRMIENQTGRKIKAMRSDNGSEFCCKSFQNILSSSGIVHQTTNPYTPEQNGVAERKNRTIVEKAKCMLFDAGLPTKFWAEAVHTAVYIMNRSTSSALNNMTPEEAFTGVKPDVSNFRIFGCDCMVHVPKEKRKKWSSKSIKMKFMGYCDNTKGFRIYNPQTRTVTKSCDVVFMEEQPNNFPIVLETQPSQDLSSSQSTEEELDSSKHESVADINDDGQEDSIIVIDSSASLIDDESRDNSIAVGEFGTIDAGSEHQDESYTSADESYDTDDYADPDYMPENALNNESTIEIRSSDRIRDQQTSLLVNVNSIDGDPLTVKQAMAQHCCDEWKKAMRDEMNSLMKNKTWILVDLPPGKKPIKSKWVFKRKFDKVGNISKYKARLVVKGYSQIHGIDYTETFAPVVRYGSIRHLLALAVKYKLGIEQMDAVTAFLQGDLSEEIYLEQPDEFNDGSSKVCFLQKAIYGLKQASREWNKKLDGMLQKFGLKRSSVDPCVYHEIDGKIMLFVAVYVDDLLIFTNDDHVKCNLKKFLKSNFMMKDIGAATSCVGMQIVQSKNHDRIEIHQSNYIRDILVKYNMADCNPISTPVDPNQKLTKDMSPKSKADMEEMAMIPYQEAVGSILYLAQCTRPDIAYAVNNVSRFNQNPGKAHWTAVKRIFRYLKGTIDKKLVYTHKRDSNVYGYSDADFASDVDERRSCTGFVFVLQGAAISWNSKRQPTVAISTTEAEYMALSCGTQEAIYLKQFENEFGIGNVDQPITLFCDNMSAIHLASNDVYHSRTKHIDVKHHFVRQSVSNCLIEVKSIGTDKMAADNLTKSVPNDKHNFCNKAIGLK